MSQSNLPSQPIAVWDLPLRLVHWSLLLLVIAAWVTTEEALYYDMTLHQYCGYILLTLVIFRLFWGFWGSRHACFRDFVCGIGSTWSYVFTLLKRQPSHYIGHNPLGGWSVVLLLLVLFIQAGSGLFANDDIFTEGPLSAWVSKDTSDLLTQVHKVNFNILLALIVLHISAILFYLIVKRENLIRPMITGYKWLATKHYSPQQQGFKSVWHALMLFVCSGLIVWLIVKSHALWHGLL